MSPRSWLLSPKLLFSHVVVLVAVATMVALGLWQLDRLAQVRGAGDRLAERLDQPPRPFAELPRPDSTADPVVDDLQFQQVTVTGTYVTGEEVLQRSRSHQGRSGYHVVTPLDTGDGAILVRRGWVPFELDEPPVEPAAPPDGEVTVTGFLERSGEQPTGFGQRDPDTGTLHRVFHIDTVRLDRQTELTLHPMVLHLESQTPAQPDRLPVPAPRPELNASTHLSYAIQWFAFSATALIVYGLWLRKRLRQLGASELSDPGASGSDAPDPPRGSDLVGR